MELVRQRNMMNHRLMNTELSRHFLQKPLSFKPYHTSKNLPTQLSTQPVHLEKSPPFRREDLMYNSGKELNTLSTPRKGVMSGNESSDKEFKLIQQREAGNIFPGDEEKK
ncbi:hypothetical protein AVEN_233452-1 [Araneus ventricosus]|uniref:Uncharacterized protein n=1 Tax=Araneus ventricosus TaxID=182803 RepID=A0A4Y2KXF6_ARAVE|nr:hypothetical protein AVEN_233452-1 [Araneus ventricosus]